MWSDKREQAFERKVRTIEQAMETCEKCGGSTSYKDGKIVCEKCGNALTFAELQAKYGNGRNR